MDGFDILAAMHRTEMVSQIIHPSTCKISLGNGVLKVSCNVQVRDAPPLPFSDPVEPD